MKRNKKLFNEIADIIDFKPELYDQSVWGGFAPTGANKRAYEEKYHLTPHNGYNAPGNDDDGRWEELGCKTAMCVAGWAASLSGYNASVRMVTVEENGETIQRPRFDWNEVTKLKRWNNRHARRDSTKCVKVVARRLLGITDAESEILFHANLSWTGEDLRAFAKGEKICEPDEI
tara:strand:+ start:239 stop:763 length:525 start_codon:yes stop_codon:yes gene_type:complete